MLPNPIAIQEANVHDLLRTAFAAGASDLHINVGTEPLMRVHGKLIKAHDRVLSETRTEAMARSILSDDQWRKLSDDGEVDLSFAIDGLCRFRVNAFRQRRVINMAFRLLMTNVPTIRQLKLPDIAFEFAAKQRGLVLVTGPTGSGKSTTLAAVINEINEKMSKHIITLEDPIEYVHASKQCLVVQREIGIDTHTFPSGLRAALRQDPDVILVGELRDLETIRTAITAAETGHLVLGTLHTPDAPQTIDRIIDVFPTDQQRQIRVQLASVLIGVLSQRLIPRLDGTGRVMALEVLINSAAVANLIRQEKIYQIKSVIQTSRQLGMQSMTASIKQWIASGTIHKDALKEYELSIGEELS